MHAFYSGCIPHYQAIMFCDHRQSIINCNKFLFTFFCLITKKTNKKTRKVVPWFRKSERLDFLGPENTLFGAVVVVISVYRGSQKNLHSETKNETKTRPVNSKIRIHLITQSFLTNISRRQSLRNLSKCKVCEFWDTIYQYFFQIILINTCFRGY